MENEPEPQMTVLARLDAKTSSRVADLMKKSNQSASAIVRAALLMELDFFEKNPDMIGPIDGGALDSPRMRAILERQAAEGTSDRKKFEQEAMRLAVEQMVQQFAPVMRPLLDRVMMQQMEKLANADLGSVLPPLSDEDKAIVRDNLAKMSGSGNPSDSHKAPGSKEPTRVAEQATEKPAAKPKRAKGKK